MEDYLNKLGIKYFTWMIKWMLWECRYQLVIGEYTGMGLPYKTDLRNTISSLEAELDRRSIS